MRKGMHHESDRFYSPDFEFVIDRRTVGPMRHSESVHWHDYCEVEFVRAGRGEHILNNAHYVLKSGSVYITTPMDFHHVFSEEDSLLEIYHMQFGCSVLNGTLMQRIMQLQSELPHGIMLQLGEAGMEVVCAGFEELLREFSARNKDGVMLMRSCLERLCILILREAEKDAPVCESSVRGNVSSAINQAVQYVRYNFRSQIMLADVAGHVHLSNNYFGNRFREDVGISFNEYLRQCRLEYAHRLLVETELTISEIAWESGFRTSSYFSDIFGRHYGMTPTELRRRNTEQMEEKQ